MSAVTLRLSTGAQASPPFVASSAVELRDACEITLAALGADRAELRVQVGDGGWDAPLRAGEPGASTGYVVVTISAALIRRRPLDDWGAVLDWCRRAVAHAGALQQIARDVARGACS